MGYIRSMTTEVIKSHFKILSQRINPRSSLQAWKPEMLNEISILLVVLC
jgi:hypothetical protein